MNTELKQKWLDGLRSGQFVQIRFFLRNETNGRCALGVLKTVGGHEELQNYLVAGSFPTWLILVNHMNDHQGLTFSEIADWVEANVPVTT